MPSSRVTGTRPEPVRVPTTTTTPFARARLSAALCPGASPPRPTPAMTIPFAPAATSASITTLSAPP